MRKVILYSAMSIDGFIATSNGGVEWLGNPDEQPEHDFGYSKFYDGIDTTLMGYNTFEAICDFDVPFPYPDKQNFVFSSHSHPQMALPVTFVNKNVEQFVADLKWQAGKDIWLVGGGVLNATLLKAGLVDVMELTMMPVVLGQGIPLFSEECMQQFHLAGIQHWPGQAVQMRYELLK